MTKQNTAIEIKGIAAIINSRKLEVPTHQRSFEWTEQVAELLDDVGSAFKRNEDYFLGSLVIISTSGGGRPKVLDGQQRLAVVSLLLTGIADQFDKIGEGKRSQAVHAQYLTKYDIKEGVEDPQLRLNNIDDVYFRSILVGKANEPEQGSPGSHRRLWSAKQTIEAWLEKKIDKVTEKMNWLAEFTEYLSKSAYVIYFTVADDANAFLIFETMNDRGLDLSIADLLKNYLLGKAKDDLPSALQLWTSAMSSLFTYGGENLFTVFIRHFWSSLHGLVREKDLYRSIKSRVTTSANAIDFANELKKNSNLYAAILSPEHEFWSEASSTARERLRTLDILGLEQYRPMLLSVLAHFQLEAIEEILRLLISWNVRLLVVGGLGGGAMENHYCELGKEIRKGELKSVKEIANRAESFIPNDAIFQESFAAARVSKSKLSRYYLRTLERCVKGDPQPELIPNTDPGELTLEHVLPERPAEDTWTQFTEEEGKAYVKRIGNMLLLKQRMNSKLRSGPFEDKREIYKESDLLLTKEVAESENWKKESIEARQAKLAILAIKVWNIKPQ